MHITSCPKCGKAYEEQSEESANNPDRLCPDCSRPVCDDCHTEVDLEGSCNCGTI